MTQDWRPVQTCSLEDLNVQPPPSADIWWMPTEERTVGKLVGMLSCILYNPRVLIEDKCASEMIVHLLSKLKQEMYNNGTKKSLELQDDTNLPVKTMHVI